MSWMQPRGFAGFTSGLQLEVVTVTAMHAAAAVGAALLVESAAAAAASSIETPESSAPDGSSNSLGWITRSEAPPLASDLLLALIFALLWPLLRLVLTRLLFQPLAHRALPPCRVRTWQQQQQQQKQQHQEEEEGIRKRGGKIFSSSSNSSCYSAAATNGAAPHANGHQHHATGGHPQELPPPEGHHEAVSKQVSKFSESCWKLLYYCLLVAAAACCTWGEEWVGRSAAFWEGWPRQLISLPLKLYYTAQCGFYFYSVAALQWWETRRRDYAVMMTHHVITIGLVSFSYVTGSFRVGSIILALHDVSDAFMEAAKLFKYSGYELMASITFAFFAISWLLLRLTYFPFWIIWSTSMESIRIIDIKDPWVPWLYYQFNTLLISLFIIHLYWWLLICRMIAKQLYNAGRVEDDIRSDSEDEDHED